MKVKIDLKQKSQLNTKNNNNNSNNNDKRNNLRLKNTPLYNDSDNPSTDEECEEEEVEVETIKECLIKEEKIEDDDVEDLVEEIAESEEDEDVKGSFAGIYNPLESIKKIPTSLGISLQPLHTPIIHNTRNNLLVSEYILCF